MPTDGTLDYLEFPARDLEAAKAFYGAAFGWTFTDYGPDYVAFNDGRVDGGFYRAESSSTTASGAVLVVVYVEDLESKLAEVTDAGGTIAKPIFSFPGGRRFHFYDPNGNELAVWTDR